MNRKLKQKNIGVMLGTLFVCALCLIAYIGVHAIEQKGNGTTIKNLSEEAEPTPGPVSVETVNYEADTITVRTNGNTKVYYSDSKQKVWNSVEGNKEDKGTENIFDDTIDLDMSWISPKADYELCLKGSEEDTIYTLEIPAYNGKLKVTFDQVDGTLDFDNDDAAQVFQWKKATTYNWKTVNVEQNEQKEADKQFLDEIEQLRLKGGKITVRIPAQNGVTTQSGSGSESFDIGYRQSKEVSVTIPKRANEVNVKINMKNFTISTQATMEYKIDSIDGVLQETADWKDCEANMPIVDVAPQALYESSGGNGKQVVIAIRKKATSKAGYSKSMYLAIPVQEQPPTEGSLSTTDQKILLTFSAASKTTPYEYLAVKEGDSFTPEKSSWKKVEEKKTVIFQEKSLPKGSAIYIRRCGVTATNTTAFAFPSAYKKIEINKAE